jgi:peptide/nickel transport system permease protein
MLIGVCVAAISAVFAATVGAVAGYYLGVRDRTLMWIVDLLLVIPSFLLVTIVAQRTKGDIFWMIVLLSVFSWMISSRIVRGMAMSLRDREFVVAARYMGVSDFRIIMRHILPNVASLLIIDTALNVGIAISAETGLSFLGFGVQAPEVSLGTLIADGTPSVLTFPWLFLFPASVLILIVFCSNLVGDGLRDAFDPSSRALRQGKRK